MTDLNQPQLKLMGEPEMRYLCAPFNMGLASMSVLRSRVGHVTVLLAVVDEY